MLYKVKFTKTGKESLLKIDKEIAKRILYKIEWLSENLDLIRLTPLKGDLSSFYKLRVGDYRILYTVDKKSLEIIIHFVGHRKDIYK